MSKTTGKLAIAAAALLTVGLMSGSAMAEMIADFDFTDGSDGFSRASDDAGTHWTTSNATDQVNGGGSGTDLSSTDNGVDGDGDRAFETTFAELDTSFSGAVSSGDYLEFTITPDANYYLDLTAVSLYVADTGGSTTGVGVKSSVDGFTDFVLQDTKSVGGNSIAGSGDYMQFSDTLDSSFTGLTDPVTFRVFMHDGGASNQSNLYRLDDVQVEGAATLVPEPASLGLGLAGMMMLMARRRLRRA